MRQGRGDQVLVGAHALDDRGPAVGVDLQHAGESGDIDAMAGSVPWAEQVGGALGQPDLRVRRQRGVRGPQPVDGRLVVVLR